MVIRVGIVGLGMAVTPHAKSLLDLKGRVQVAYAFSPSVERRRKFAERFPFRQCDRVETILQDDSVDAVLILTPPNTHLELAERCAAAGKHVLLEKPLEISTARAERLVEIFSEKKLKLGIVLQHRFRPAAERLREVLPELGRIVSASAMIPNWRPQSYYDQPGRGSRARDGGGVLLTQGIHTEDLACAAVRFKSGALGVVHATTAAYPGFPERIELIGTEGTALLEGTFLQVDLHDKPSIQFSTDAGGGGTGADPMAFPHDWHRSLLADFLYAIEKNLQPRVNGAEGLKVHRFIDQLLQTR
jgi:predicted dehydrogenase